MSTKDLKSIDTALGLMGEFGKLSHGTSQKINAMRQEAIFTDGEISAKLKLRFGVSAHAVNHV